MKIDGGIREHLWGTFFYSYLLFKIFHGIVQLLVNLKRPYNECEHYTIRSKPLIGAHHEMTPSNGARHSSKTSEWCCVRTCVEAFRNLPIIFARDNNTADMVRELELEMREFRETRWR